MLSLSPMRFADLISSSTVVETRDAANPDVTAVTEDSRRVRPGSLFVAIPGTVADGHAYVEEALARGAAALVLEREVSAAARVPRIVVPSTRRALATLAAEFHGHPARALRLIGFTGTFGKTTTSEVLRALLEAAGRPAGVLGSLGARRTSLVCGTGGLTTPAPVELHAALRALGEAGARTVVMEVTSHALRLERVHGLRFGGGLISAILPGEHTDFHRTFDDYVAAKRRFLELLAPGAILAFDGDDRTARELAEAAQVRGAAGLRLTRPGAPTAGEVAITCLSLDAYGALLTVGGRRVRSALLGRSNVRNVGLALAYAVAEGLDLDTAAGALARLAPLPRRMERLALAGRTVLDDTAAHPDSLQATFEVAALVPHAARHVAWAVRGGRGADSNRRIALALGALTATPGVRTVIVTAAAEAVGPPDRATADEVDAARDALFRGGAPFIWHDTLQAAMKELARRSSPGDLLMLVGAQGMNEGRRMLELALQEPASAGPPVHR
jgi:UDP-N-acetylmuramoyl-L-alanyl-D-glutamate--2,6-diaminopimelate ligase